MFALALCAVLGVAAAQITIFPTLGTGNDQIAKGLDSASVDQIVQLTLPQATALHLAADVIAFNLNYLDGPGWEARAFGDAVLPDGVGYACVYVSGADVVSALGEGEFWGQTQVVPGGIAYHAETWDEIDLVYFGNGMPTNGLVPDDQLVVTYPPIRIVEGTGLVEHSKDYFVCYQTFVLQLFSNWGRFDLQVARSDTTGQGIEHLYVQANTCYDFGSGTGLYDLPDGQMRHLLPKSQTVGPTGTFSSEGCNPNSSWMDVLGVLAVKVNADLYGTSTANLLYTLVSSDTAF